MRRLFLFAVLFLALVLPGIGFAATQIFSDGFENNDFATVWTATADYTRSTAVPDTGTYSINVNGLVVDATMNLTSGQNIGSYNYCNLTSRLYIATAFDAGEYLCMDYSNDGGSTWNRNTGSDGAVGGLCQDGNVDTENAYRTAQYNIPNPAGITSFKFRFRAATNLGNENGYIDNVNLTCTDTSPPQWSSNRTNFTALTYSPNPISLELNVTWNDAASAMGTVTVEHNFSGLANYSVTSFSGSEYYYWWGGILGAGSYAWKGYANDSQLNTNATNSFYFTVGKAAPTMYLYLNSSRGNIAIGGGTDLNLTASLVSPSSGNIEIRTNYSDGIDKQWDTGASPLENTSALSVAGTYYFNATFSGNENYTSASEKWIATVLQPYLEVKLTNPPTDAPSDAIQNYTFIVNATITCRQGLCGTVQGTVRYNASGPDPDAPVSTTYGATPIFINETPALAQKTCGAMSTGDSCNLSWVINASGSIGQSVKIGVLFNSTTQSVQENHTGNATVSITTCVVDMTTSWTSIDFGNLVPNTAGNAAPGNDGGLYNVTVNPGSCNTDLYIKGTNLTNDEIPTYIPVMNLSWSNTTNTYSAANAMQLTYLPVKTNIAGGTNVTTWYWLDVPPVFAGRYNGTVYILGVKNGQSPP